MSISQFDNSGFYPAAGLAGRSVDDTAYDSDAARSDVQMDQIRDLILGDFRRTFEARLSTLETRLQTLEDKLDAVRHDTRADRDDHVAALAAGIDELGRHVRRLATR